MKPPPTPPPPRWLWFAAVAGLALLASLTVAAGRDPPPGSQALGEPARSTTADTDRSEAALNDTSPTFDHRCLLCRQLPH